MAFQSVPFWPVHPEFQDAERVKRIVNRVPNRSRELCDRRVACLWQENRQSGHDQHQDCVRKVALGKRHVLILRYASFDTASQSTKQPHTDVNLQDFVPSRRFTKRNSLHPAYKGV